MKQSSERAVPLEVLRTNFWRQTIDTIAMIYMVIIVALIVGQQIAPLEFKMFSYTSVGRDGAAHDYCNPEPLYNIGDPVIAQLYSATFPGAVLPGSSAQQVQEMILDSAGIYGAEYPFNLFSVSDRHFCIGPQHYAAAYNLKYHRSTSAFWSYVIDHNDEIYGPSIDREGWIASLLATYAIPVWAFMVCRFIYEMIMLRQLAVHQKPTDKVLNERIENVVWFNIFSSLLPFFLNSISFILLIMKLMGMWLTDSSGICVIAILYGVAIVCKWIPIFMMRIMLRRNEKKVPPIVTPVYVLNKNMKAGPTEWIPLTAFYAMTLIVTIIIASLYISNDLTGLTFKVFTKQCTEYDGRISTYDSCVDWSGVGYKSTTAHLFLAYLSPIFLLIIWRMLYFAYYMYKWGNSSQANEIDTVDAQIQAGVAFLSYWRVEPREKTTDGAYNGFEIKFKTPLTGSGTAAERKTKTQLILLCRFLIPLVIGVVGILLGLLKLSQYALWSGCPWWVIGVLFASSIMIAILTDVVPMLFNKAEVKKKQGVV